MRLEKVVLNGFKSFADKTEFVFDSPVTGIVGPNGCGKSNVVDAVKWVLGEQSVKSLRSGQRGGSEYRINNKLCRLKDVRELLMDTGIGTHAYSILEQGQVEHLVSASKTDRRFIFEEAAGISKYKAHKKEELRKLERPEKNLLRLADIFGEVA